jgi:phage gp29-like protein
MATTTPQILDHLGNPISSASAQGARSRQTATLRELHTDLETHPGRALTPRRVNNILLQAEQGDLLPLQDLADDMQERDGKLFAVLGQRAAAVQLMPISVTAPDNATAAEKALAQQATELWQLAALDLPQLVGWCMDGVLKGFAPVETTWDYRDGYQLPTLAQAQQRWFVCGQGQGSAGSSAQARASRDTLLLRTTDGAQPLRPLNWLIHRHPALCGYTSRQALARVLVWPYLFKHYALRDLAEFLEIYGIPLRLGTYPITASDEDKATLLRAVSEIGHNAAGIIPQGMAIDFQSAADGKHEPFFGMADYMDGIMAMVVLGQTLTSSEGQHGTQALGTVHNDVRLDIAEADARLVGQTLTEQLLRPLVALNLPMPAGTRLPRVVLDAGRDEDLGPYAENLPKLANAGLRIGVQWAHSKLRIPMAADGEAVLQGAEAPPAAPTPTGPARQALKARVMAALAAQAAAQAQPQFPPNLLPDNDELDDLVAEMVDEWEPAMSPLVQPLLSELDAAIDNGESIQSLRDRLPALIGRMDASALAALIARGGFVANTAAQAGVLPFDPADINPGV